MDDVIIVTKIVSTLCSLISRWVSQVTQGISHPRGMLIQLMFCHVDSLIETRGDHSHEFSKSSITRASLSDFLHNSELNYLLINVISHYLSYCGIKGLYQVWAGDDGGPEGNDSLESPKLYKVWDCIIEKYSHLH